VASVAAESAPVSASRLDCDNDPRALREKFAAIAEQEEAGNDDTDTDDDDLKETLPGMLAAFDRRDAEKSEGANGSLSLDDLRLAIADVKGLDGGAPRQEITK